MTRDEAVDIIAKRLGQRVGMSAQIIAELKLAQIRLEHSPELPWFLISESTVFATGTTAGSTTLPTGFLREVEDENMLIQDTDLEWTEVAKLSGAVGRIRSIGGLGRPKYYSLFSTYLRFFPDPNLSYSLYWPFYKTAAVLNTDIENDWLKHHPDTLICSAGIQMARFLRDPAAVSLFEVDLRVALSTMQIDTEARRQAGSRSEMGG